jgi:hypothetical protein
MRELQLQLAGSVFREQVNENLDATEIYEADRGAAFDCQFKVIGRLHWHRLSEIACSQANQ